MISGALSSMSLLSLLFLLMTLLYRSFRSDVANLPPSSGTSGRSSGGNTGIISRIIHSGLTPDTLKASTTFNLLAIFFFFASLAASLMSTRRVFPISSMLIFFRHSRIASAPMPAPNPSPNFSRASIYFSSLIISQNSYGELPGSHTIYISK